MAKDSFYFSHDYNARNDRKIVALVRDYKAAGYGIFWATGEMMHEEGDKLDYDDITFGAIAKDLNEEIYFVKEVIDNCITTYKLFLRDGDILTSNRVKKNLNGREERKNVKSEAGRLGGIKSGESRRTKQNEAPLEANEAPLGETKQRKEKERKEKERKEKESIIISNTGGNEDFVCRDVEYYVTNNKIIFEKICIATGKGTEEVKKELHNFHLWMEKKEKYPTGNKAVVAGLESWILNAKGYKAKYNGTYTEQVSANGSIPHNLKKIGQ